jgi:uncharacterized protein (TIGR02597 family)
MRRHFLSFAAVTSFALLAFGAFAQAQTVATDPVGAISINLVGNSDNFVSLPFHRPVALETQVVSISGNTVTVSAAANLTASEFVYVAGTQPNTYYLQFTSGSRDGMYYTVTANDGSSITVDPNGDAGLDGNVSVGDTFRIIPYWTLNTLFPIGQGVNGSPGPLPAQRNTAVLLPPNNVPGVDLVPSTIYYYYNGSANVGAGWRQAGASFSTLQNDAIVFPDSYFVVRNAVPGNNTLTLVGAVVQSDYSTPLTAYQANTGQDIFVGVNVPVPVTLADSNLASALTPSTGFIPSQRGDELLAFDPTVTGIDVVPSDIYYYYSGSAAGGPGWREAGQPASTIFDSTQVFQPGQAYLIRKVPTSIPQTTIWSFAPSYLP